MADCIENQRPHFTFIWTLENVTERTYLGLTSPPFVVDTIDKSEWCLVLWERKDKLLCVPCKNHDDCGLESIEIEYETSVLTANGTVLNKKRQKKCFESEFVFNVRGSSGFGENVLLDQKDKVNLNGKLTIRCRMWKPENEACYSGFNFALTRLKQERRCFTWTIPEFSSVAVGDRRSFYLQVTPKGGLFRVLDLYLNCDDDDDKVCIAKPKNFPYEVFCEISVVSAVGNVVSSKSISDDSALIKISKLMSNKSLYLPNDTLVLKCDCEIDFGVVSHQIESYEQFSILTNKQFVATVALNDDRTEMIPCCLCNCSLKNVVKTYYENGELTDVNLRAGSETFPAHKIILSAKSKVFEEMFTKEKSKKGRRIIELTDIHPNTLRLLLKYIYSEEVDEDSTPESAMQLYKAAIKYKIEDLKVICSSILESKLCMANIFDILGFAEKHQDENLKFAARMFIFRYDREIFGSPDWKNFKKRNPMLAMDVKQHISELTHFTISIMNQYLGQMDD